MIGIVVEGTDSAQEDFDPRDRLALVEVIAGFRLEEVPTHVEVVAGDLDGWGYPTYAESAYVFLRIEDGVDLDSGIPDGPCSWQPRYTQAEIDHLLALAE